MTITDAKKYVEELREIKDVLQISLTLDEIEELTQNLGTDDFHISLNSREYRFIDDGAIEEIYEETIRQIVEECYDCKLPDFVAIDWAETAQNCLVDGYGHTFSHYDGSEETAGSYYISRTN